MTRMSPEIAMKYLGLQADGNLSRCVEMPNGVCSQYEDDKSHYLEAIPFKGTVEDAKRRLQTVIVKGEQSRLVADNGPYMRFEFRSKFFKFTDDVEFLILADQGTIHFRSASRLGYWDLGANRKRMQQIRKNFAKS